MTQDVPVFTLARARARFEPELLLRWRRILDQDAYVLSAEVAEFEAAFARATAAAGCVGVANGTDALVLALRALGARAGTEVLLPGFTFFATFEAIWATGATPVCVDIDLSTHLLDLTAAAERVSEKTVGLVGVHLYGMPLDVVATRDFCARHRLFYLEDAAQAHGASSHGIAAGAQGDAAAWSFYPSKNLGCFGDGGAVTARDPARLELIRRLGNHGQSARYQHSEIGTNSRLDALQAAVLNCRLPRLAEDNARRDQIVGRYRAELSGAGDLELQGVAAGARPAWHLAVVRTERRDGLAAHLRQRGVGSAIHYPAAIPEQPAAAAFRDQLEWLPRARAAARSLLALPLFPELTDDEVARVIEAVRGFYRAPQ